MNPRATAQNNMWIEKERWLHFDTYTSGEICDFDEAKYFVIWIMVRLHFRQLIENLVMIIM